MKKYPFRFFILILIFVFAFCLMPTMSYAIPALPYGMTSTSISVGSGSTLASGTTQVGFGGRRWYVVGFNGTGINKGDGTISLLSKDATGSSAFNTASDIHYDGSNLQTSVNSLLPSIDSGEQSSMVGLTLNEVGGTQPTDQKIWALSTSDASIVSQDVRKLSSPWWLRSATAYGTVGYVMTDGTIPAYGLSVTSTIYSVRPGTTIDLTKVLYAAPATGAKGSGVNSMNSVNLGSEIKFTILNNTNLGLSIADAPPSLSVAQGGAINLNFSGAHTGANKYVSCVLVSQTDSLVKYYAKLSTAASGAISIPTAGVQPGSYTLLIYNEQISSGDNSDYASTPVSISLTVTGSTNSAPRLKAGVPSTAAASVSVSSAYTLNLSTIFEDPDGNALSYRVYINGSGSAVAADKNYTFTPTVAGITTLRFTAYDGAAESPSYTVTLTATNVLITGITVTAENGASAIGTNGQLQLHYTVQPSNATNKEVTWTVNFINAGSQATGSVDYGGRLTVSNAAPDGIVKIRATAQDGSGVYGELNLNISQNIVARITVTAASEDLAVGDTTMMTAEVSPSTAYKGITWSISSGSNISSIAYYGLLTLNGSGTVTVRATAQDGSGVYGEKTLHIKGIPSAPPAPLLYSKTSQSITLRPAAGEEFSMDSVNWQSSTTFSSLEPNTAYNFYARMAETGTMRASPASPALSVTTSKAILGGSVSITGTFVCGQTLTADASGLTSTPSCSLGTLYYQWTRDTVAIHGATSDTYNLVADDFGKVINVTVSAENCTGSRSSGNTAATVKADPDYTVPTGLTAVYGDTLANVTLPAGFAWEAPSTPVGEPGSHSFTVTYTPDDPRYNIVTGIAVTVTVGKATPTVTAPAASGITYGEPLSRSFLSGGSTGGSFAWADPTIVPAVSDSNTTEYSVIFTPTDTVRYNTANVKVTLTVDKAMTYVISAPSASAVIYGQTLSDSTLTGGRANVPGSFVWTDGTTQPDVYESPTVASYSVTFTPSDTANYSTSTTSAAITVNKATPSITAAPGASAITYGQALSDSTLSGGTASVAGSFKWTNGSTKPAVSDSNTTAYSVTFTPADTRRYNTTTTAVTLAVNKAAASVTTAPTASAIMYGQMLADSTLSGGAGSVPGTFVWTDGTIKPAISDSGTTAYSVTFISTDGNYNTTTTTVKLTVNKAATSITTAPAASAITYGQTLSDSTLSGGAGSVPGSFSWTDGTIKPAASDSGMTAYSVTFTPTDGNYNKTTTTVTLTVNKAATSILTAPAASAITFGQTLSDSTLSGGAGSVPGRFAWTNGTIKPAVSQSGTTAYSVTFIPTDNGNYNTITTTVTLTVNKAAASILTAPTASAITYGQALGDSTLSGGAGGVPGSFAWTDEAIKPAVSDSDTTAFSVTFTPTDTDNYNTTTTDVTLTVNKAATSVTTAPTASAITYGQTLSDSTLSGGAGSVPGSFTWTNGTIKPAVSDSATTAYSVTFTPTDNGNYSTITTTVTLTVNKAAASILTAPAASAITYGQTLADSSLSGGTGSVPGSFAWTDRTIKPAVSDSDTTAFSVTFTPTDTGNYKTTTTTVTLTVNKVATSVTTAPTASAITYGQTLADSSLSGGAGSVPGSFAWTDGAIKPAISDSDTTAYSVTFTPTDAANYSTATTTVKLAINKATPSVTVITSAKSVRYKDMVTLTAIIVPQTTASPLTGSVEFRIGSVVYGAAKAVPIPGDPSGAISATVIVQESELPGNYAVTAVFTSTSPNYQDSRGSSSLTVIARDASPYYSTGFYAGDLFAWTTGSNSSTATVTLTAVIKDNNIPSGDVRAAKVTFYIADGNKLTPISGAKEIPVGLKDGSDGTMGIASAVVQLNIGKNNSQGFNIAVGISGGYTNDPFSTVSDTVVTVAKLISGGRIVGGGDITNGPASAGLIKGANSALTHFTFDVSYNNKQTNASGRVQITVRSFYKQDGTLDSVMHEYSITSNSITLLNVNSPTATFSSKATLMEKMPDGTIVSIGGSFVLQMTLTDGKNGSTDSISITFTGSKSAGGLWFSNSWDPSSDKSNEQNINLNSEINVQ